MLTTPGTRVGRVVYVTGMPLPTTQAHGVYMVKMCEAFAGLGGAVTLLYPRRGGNPAPESDASLFEYYGVPRTFGARPLTQVELLPWLKKRSPGWLRPIMASSHYLRWGFRAALQARRSGASLHVTHNPEIALWLVLLGLPTLLDLHEPFGTRRRSLLGPLKRSKHLLAVSTPTSYTRQWLVEVGFQPDKVTVLPNGVDLKLYRDLPNAQACRERLGLPASGPIVGYVGRFQAVGREKGISELVRAMSLLAASRREAPLLLCVGGPMEAVPAYLQVAADAGLARQHLRFVDRVPSWEVPFWIRACDVVTVPWPWSEFSAYVTSPLKLFEYMAAERAIVASDLPSIREILSHGWDAWLVKPGDPEALADGIAHLLSTPGLAVDLARRAREAVGAYTWERRAAAMWQRTGREGSIS